jgi:predicted TIM-barrel fold metal-dependent hydrolase
VEPIPLIDHHCHGVTAAALDGAGVEALLTESPDPPPPGTSGFDSQLGFAVRRWCAPVLGLEPFATAGSYTERRAQLGPDEVNHRLLRAAGVQAWLVDTGYRPGQLLTPGQMRLASDSSAHEVVRLEAVAEQVARGGVGAAGYAAAVEDAIGARSGDAVAFKSIAAYRCGLGFTPAPPARGEVSAAAGRWLRELDADPAARLADPVLIRHAIWAGLDLGLPLQFHAGFGDPDLRLHQADPSLLHDFLLATRAAGTAVMLLHCYPYHRQAAWLAQVFPHVYLDVGLALNHVGARSAAVLAEALELAPFHKVLYSSDAFGLAELHYLGAAGFRRDLARVTGAFVADGAWSQADADRVSHLIGAQNARRVYRLPPPDRRRQVTGAGPGRRSW